MHQSYIAKSVNTSAVYFKNPQTLCYSTEVIIHNSKQN